MKPQKIVGVVQARMGSTRLPGKVLMPVAGAPLLVRMIERLHAARSLDQVVVATTALSVDAPIVALCQQLEIPVCAGHPTDLLDRHRLAAHTFGADVVVKIPSDCPLVDPQIVDRVVNLFRSRPDDFDYVGNLHPASYPDGNDVEVLPRKILDLAWREAAAAHEREHTTPFVWDRPERFRLANVRWESGLDLSMSHRFTIDYPEDLAFVRAVFGALYRPGLAPFSLGEILGLLEQRPDILALNQHLAGVNWYRHHLADLRTVGPDQTVLREMP